MDNCQHHYASYEEWKGWDDYFTFTPEDSEYFFGELRGIELAGKKLLEIGFGQGNFLAWAKEVGASITGTEISEKSRVEAERFGVELLQADIENIAEEHQDRFDVIVAFDVFEHLTLEKIIEHTRAAETMLRPGGHLVLRFPNAQSPFGLAPQNGDITHISALSKPKFEQICQATSLQTERYTGSYRIRGSFGAKYLGRCMRYLAQDIGAKLLNFVYARDIPWDAVVVLVMRKTNDRS